MMLAGAQIIDEGSVAYIPENDKICPPNSGPQHGTTPVPSYSYPNPSEDESLARRPTKEPVDIQFTNITCTVKLGINKGNYFNSFITCFLQNTCCTSFNYVST